MPTPISRAVVVAIAVLALLVPVAAPAAGPAAATPALAPLPEHWHHGAFMEIFVRAWKDSDGDGIGDLKGLTSTLPYLQELGIRGIWLMPIQANADGDHGYATTDFRAVAPEYGTLADFDELVREARARGIGIIVDYVVNHAAASHPFFVEARQGPGSRYRDWFVWSPTLPKGWDIWGKNPWYAAEGEPWKHQGPWQDLPPPPPDARNFYFGTFGPHMPDFNLRNPAVVRYHLESLDFWLQRGLAGFRLDAVPHLIENDARHWNDQPESRALTRRLQDFIKRDDARLTPLGPRFVVCEATAAPDAYGDPAVCGGAFAFGYVEHIVRAVRGEPASIWRVADHWRHASPTMATFLSNHDIFAGRRLWDQLGGDLAAMKLAAATYLLQPGTPFVYYGEEIGQAGVHGLEHGLRGDPPIRSPMSWAPDPVGAGFTTGAPFRPIAPNVRTNNVQAQRADPHSLWHFYKAMIGLRNAWPSIARGSFEGSRAASEVVQWQRRLGDEHTLVVINYGRQASRVGVESLGAGARLRPLWPQSAPGARANRSGMATLAAPPRSVSVYLVQPAPAAGREALTGAR